MSSAPAAPLTPGGSSTALPPAVPPVPTSGPSTGPIPASGTAASTRVSNATASTFAIPNGISLTQFDGSDWANWSNTLEAVLCLHEVDDIVRNAAPPAGVDPGEWNVIHRRGLAYLRLFIKPGEGARRIVIIGGCAGGLGAAAGRICGGGVGSVSTPVFRFGKLLSSKVTSLDNL